MQRIKNRNTAQMDLVLPLLQTGNNLLRRFQRRKGLVLSPAAMQVTISSGTTSLTFKRNTFELKSERPGEIGQACLGGAINGADFFGTRASADKIATTRLSFLCQLEQQHWKDINEKRLRHFNRAQNAFSFAGLEGLFRRLTGSGKPVANFFRFSRSRDLAKNREFLPISLFALFLTTQYRIPISVLSQTSGGASPLLKEMQMTDFTLHTQGSAPQESQPLLDNSLKAFGMIPNLHAVMAESPQHLEAYQKLHELFQQTSLTPTEQNVVWLTINVEHACHYCVPAHTAIAHMQKVDETIIEDLRHAAPLADTKLEALRQFTLKVVRQRGNVSNEDVQAFLAAGYTNRQVLDVILGLAQKVMSNYVNHLADTPVDAPFQKFDWTPSAAAAE